MKKKTIKIDGLEYELKSNPDEKVEPIVEDPKPIVEEGEEISEEKIDEISSEAAEKISAKLGLKELLKQVADMKKEKEVKPENKLIDLEKLMSKSVKDMTIKEKVVGFFQAMLTGNHTVLKALSEGTAADGKKLITAVI
jgi:hypothetical protein